MNVREILRGPRTRQTPQALKAAGRMALALPLIQAFLAVAAMNAEYWQALLGLEGLLIGALAANQLAQRDMQYRLLGLGIAWVNGIALSVIGLFLGSHLFWITGLAGLAPISWLVLSPTTGRSVTLAWAAYALILTLLLGAAGFARYCVETAPEESGVASRRFKLDIAWGAFTLRGGNSTERAMLRLRMAQTAFEVEDWESAFVLADDGLAFPDRRSRAIADSPIAEHVLRSLLLVKSVAYYNRTWGKSEPVETPVKSAPLDDETRNHPQVRLRWGY